MLDTPDYPSLGYMIEQGATTVWERWNSDKEGPDMNSRNHFCLGAMAQWFYEELVGLKPDGSAEGSGFRRLTIAPRPTAGVTFAEFNYAAPQGEVAVRWELRDGAFTLDLTLPPNVTADVRLPSGSPGDTTVDGPVPQLTDFDSYAEVAVLELHPGRYRLRTPAGDAVPEARQVAALHG